MLIPMAVALAMQAAPAVASPPAPVVSLGSLFSEEDYPAEILRREIGGEVGFRLSIDAEGRPTACTTVSSSGDVALDQHTCALLMERATFRPARSASGEPTEGVFSSRMIWRVSVPLPPNRMVLLALETVMTVTVTDQGPRCAFHLNGMPRPFGDDCRNVPAGIMELAGPMTTGQVRRVAVSVLPENGAIMPTMPPNQRLLVQSEAQFSVNSAGEVSNCRVVAQHGEAGPGHPGPPDLCSTAWTPRFLRPEGGRRTVRTRFSVRLYESEQAAEGEPQKSTLS